MKTSMEITRFILLAILGLVSMASVYIGVGYIRKWAKRLDLIDLPNERSSHLNATPRGGGVVIVAVVLFFNACLAAMYPSYWRVYVYFAAGALLVAAIGWFDDLHSLPSSFRFSIHILAAVVAVTGLGYWHTLELPLVGTVVFGGWGSIVSVIWIVGLTNAYNFMDGTDGMAGGQALIAGIGWMILGWQSGFLLIAGIGFFIASGSLGFLMHNWYPARVFMGDVCSGFLGYTFALLPVIYNYLGEGRPGSPIVGLLLVWPFVFDTSFTFVRRLYRRENVFAAHRSHLYQRMSSVRHGHEKVALVYMGMTVLGCLLAQVWSSRVADGDVDGLLVLPFLCLGLWVLDVTQERNKKNANHSRNSGKALSSSEFEFGREYPKVRSRILKYRKIIVLLFQAVALVFIYYVSYLLRFDFDIDESFLPVFFKTLPILLVVKLALFSLFKLSRGWWRYAGISDLLDIIKATVCSGVLFCGLVYLIHGFFGFPRSIFVIDPVLTIVVIGGMRLAIRAYAEAAREVIAGPKVLVVGTGSTASAIAREVNHDDMIAYNIVGFVVDDPSKQGERIHGIQVLGGIEDLPQLILKYGVSQILIALPSATGKQMQRIINFCTQCKVEFKKVPALADIINGSPSLWQFRQVRVEDLLVREPVRLDLAGIQKKFQHRVVLITGAAGSIGSELARQIAGFEPEKLLLFDRSENDLYRLEVELTDKFPKLQRTQIVGDILDVGLLQEIMSYYRPSSIFHAAAYKHVPMMEANCFQAVKNNIFGTHNVALAAQKCGIEDMVLISSDKAVNPCNIMGVTKRVAEILIMGLQGHSTRYVSVRFGNVLGSNGSVVPLFERQIAARKPVTVTHPEVRRYFMTIPEAVQLVLQASTMGKGGEIFVLDMGEPMKIVDLANDLIRLSGFEPGKEIPIIFTGLRPGEKLFEELQFNNESLKVTDHEKIRIFNAGSADPGQIAIWLEELAAIVAAKNVGRLIAKLKEIVPEYTPSPIMLDLAKANERDSVYQVSHG
jgi:FlaA1/EpsC-like NDP-sugar epimerase/UDP-N-acetylmuramyl pentapeptide phosphotransferase/UDP-N-acetylglucosamine-1-phosphate transferase